MQHLVSTLQGYVINEVLHRGWLEFVRLFSQADSIRKVHDKHINVLDRALNRCLLGVKLKPVKGLIDNAFGCILKTKSMVIL